MNQENIDLVREVLSEAAMTEEEKLLRSYRITPETKLPPMQPLFKMFGTPCFYRGELVAACGKAKSGKTLFLSILMAAGLTEKVLALELNTDCTDLTDFKPLRVLWIDTEQSQQSTQDIIVNRIIPLIESSPADLDSSLFAYNLRGLGYEKRREVVETAVRIVKPDLVIIDGIKDLITDINDAVQATQIMEHLMSLAYPARLHRHRTDQQGLRGIRVRVPESTQDVLCESNTLTSAADRS